MKEEAIFLNMEGNPPTEKEEVKRVMVVDMGAKCSLTSPQPWDHTFFRLDPPPQ